MEERFTICLPDIIKELNKQFSGIVPDSDDVSRLDLEAQRKIWLDDDIGYNVIEIQRLIMRWNIADKGVAPEMRKPIWLYIMSYGGDLDYM